MVMMNFGIRRAADKVVIIAKEDNFFIESITLFSYLFCAFLFVTAIFWFFNAVIRSRLRWSKMQSVLANEYP